MIIVAIAWLYVVILMAVMQPTLASAAGTLVGYGLIPLAIVLWIMGAAHRLRRARAVRQSMPVDEVAHQPDDQHPKRDQ